MISVLKAVNQKEPYNEEKIRTSLSRAGVPSDLQSEVVSHINKRVYEDIPTQHIYNEVRDYLGKSAYPYTKSLYGLKQAIMDLGPTGYPFEDFVSQILITLGYTTEVRQILRGKCIQHEIDVIAKKENAVAMIEAKFHNALGTRSDVHVPMYTKARFDDVKEQYRLTEAWVITNTKTTSEAIAYAECVGMKIVSWSYPTGKSLRELIESAGLHPITLLTTLSNNDKVQLLQNHVVRCKTIHENPALLDALPLSDAQKLQVMSEIDFVCKGEHQN